MDPKFHKPESFANNSLLRYFFNIELHSGFLCNLSNFLGIFLLLSLEDLEFDDLHWLVFLVEWLSLLALLELIWPLNLDLNLLV